ncbi:hypothetical protein [Streptomyces sp. TRM64462]|uniref:hypothetical protein n=1 Tax=Streptomyces sp. TRM64462 TaxID=2741726 RepID=UPI001586CAA8|nr:hypothetical protein [Streptomyces sp. TRM64462]
MTVSAWKRVGVTLTAAAVVAGAAGCQSGGEQQGAGQERLEWSSATQVIRTAYEKTADAKSAKVHLTMSMPAGLATGADSGELEMSGVMGWNPSQMDLTMKGGPFEGAGAGAPGQMRLLMVDNVLYVKTAGGAKSPVDELFGDRWIKIDFAAAAEKSGDAALRKEMTRGLENMNQDPAKQLAMLLESPNLKHIGPEKIDGVEAQHYKGTLTVEEMVAANTSLSVLSKEERDELVANMKNGGLKAYDTEVWVNEDGYPVKMDVGMVTPQGTMKVTATYSDYGTKAGVQAPPPGETADIMEMLGDLVKGAEGGADGTGEDAGAGAA